MIPNWLLQRAYLTPDRPALSFGEKQWTFCQLKEEAMKKAGQLLSSQLINGDRVALLGSSTPEMVFVIHACMLAGLEMVMLNSRLSKTEIEWQLKDAEVQQVIVSDELMDLVNGADVKVVTVNELSAMEETAFLPERSWHNDRTITVMYTSGTTGFPKGVRQTAGNHTSSALSSVLNLGLSDKDVWLCAMPLFHISGFSILVRSILYGMEVRLYEKFDAHSAASDIRDGKATRMSVVAVTLEKVMGELIQNGWTVSPEFRSMLVGGGPVARSTLERAQMLGIPVLQTYGMTETSSQTATLSAEDALRKIGSAGKPLFFNEIAIDGAKKPKEIGEIIVRGPHVTPGYIGRFTEKQPLVEGWLHTGDLGYLDDEGYLFVMDRRSDLIISGGENIYPAEIESVLMGYPAVQEAGVCGLENDEWGTVPVAFIVSQGEVTEEMLLKYCADRLAKYKIPKRFVFVDQLPRNASNKLLRRELKKLLPSKK
ncbi:o-succinylbenzoate--CoA ligase [Sporosarcina sp. Te-1]|uniref:o-succinylbenzoate--CoA ligase n=1 Tax=Sporosarcina sp. Te-1 TaxID=2818390 RepID=UPI001A9ECA22|nr:o-succinylbenzoate--CoA ligase [Sporosarcina sp. Te-1]QTD43352.1 o-succinylbenzoate--CoA ligase [Sporosarcina sp. Te-1]